MADKPKQSRGEVKLNPALQQRLLEQMREEQAAAVRGQAIRRYLVLPLVIAVTVVSGVMMLYGDATESLIGNFLGSSLLFFLWMIRKRIGSVFGF